MNHHDNHSEGCIAHFGVPHCDCGAEPPYVPPDSVLASRWFLIAILVCAGLWMLAISVLVP